MRIGFVDLIKLLFAFIVCFYHFFNVVSPNPYFPLGDLTVEVFVLIAGIFLWRSQKSANPVFQSPYAFLKKRFLRFFPYSLAGFLIAFAAKVYLTLSSGTDISSQTIGNWLTDGLWDVLMIKMNGMNGNAALLNVPAWTLSAMLLSEFLAVACMHNNQRLFTTLIAPLTIIIGLGIWRHIPSATHHLWMGITTFGLLRVWILYCLSWYCYKLMLKIQETQWTKAGKYFLTFLEILCYVLAILIIMNQTSRNYRWFATLLLFAAIAVSVSGKSLSSSILTHKTAIFCIGELSMGVYLTHYPIMQIFRSWYPGEEVLDHAASFLYVVLAASVTFSIVVVYGKKLFATCHRKLKSKLIAERSVESPTLFISEQNFKEQATNIPHEKEVPAADPQ